MADERLTIRRYPGLSEQFFLLSRRMQAYSTHEPRLVALICAMASPTVCATARPGDGAPHPLPLGPCDDCDRVVCSDCLWCNGKCKKCEQVRMQCDRCVARPVRCARCQCVIPGCMACIRGSHVTGYGRAHSPLCADCSRLMRCAFCGVTQCATCDNRFRFVLAGSRRVIQCNKCLPPASKKRKRA